MFTKEEISEKLSVDVTEFTTTDNEITFKIGDKYFELQKSGLFTQLPDCVHEKKECHFKVNNLDELEKAVNSIPDWIDDWND